MFQDPISNLSSVHLYSFWILFLYPLGLCIHCSNYVVPPQLASLCWFLRSQFKDNSYRKSSSTPFSPLCLLHTLLKLYFSLTIPCIKNGWILVQSYSLPRGKLHDVRNHICLSYSQLNPEPLGSGRKREWVVHRLISPETDDIANCYRTVPYWHCIVFAVIKITVFNLQRNKHTCITCMYMYVCIDVHVVFNFKIHSGEPHTQTSL